jgi:hypothetical protein
VHDFIKQPQREFGGVDPETEPLMATGTFFVDTFLLAVASYK